MDRVIMNDSKLNLSDNKSQKKHKNENKPVNTLQNNLNINKIQNRVAVILGYYNGNKFLSEQVNSIFNQSHPHIHFFISDDHSSVPLNLTQLNLNEKEKNKTDLNIRLKNVGFSNNFLNALEETNDQFDYFSFCDQDDIWNPDKIENAIALLSQTPSNKPALYCARTFITDEKCQKQIGESTLFKKPASFCNALVQCLAGANTMVFNKAARDLIVQSSLNAQVVSHDWWCYQIITGAGGTVYYDSEPCLKYRQHEINLVGTNNNLIGKWIRIKGLFEGKLKSWNDINIVALKNNRDLLTVENQHCLDNFIKARQSALFKRLYLFKRAGIYRQTSLGNLGLWVGAVMNKI